MTQPAKSNRAVPIWPFGALYIAGLIILWSAGVSHLATEGKEEEFLRTHDSTDGYLIPVECGILSRGTENIDYVRGTVAIQKQHFVKPVGEEVCLYSRPAFDRLFSYLIQGDATSSHQAQADRIHAKLVRPSRQSMIAQLRTVSVIWGVMSGLAAYLAYRRNKKLT